MAIKNKDGTIYQLTKPNPIMSNQELWNGRFILHNFDIENEPKKYQPIEEIQPQEIKVQIKEAKVPPEQKTKKKQQPIQNIIIAYCMPAILNEVYEYEKKLNISYGKQFTFETIITESNDFMIKLWTNKDISIHSVIYLPKHLRWWKVEKIEGMNLLCIPSILQPSFSQE